MKLTKSNFKKFVPKKEQKQLRRLLEDLNDVNLYHNTNKLYIDWQDWHDEYSCERTDPCPDYYGYYRLKFENISEGNVADVMTIDELENALFVLFTYNYLQNIGNEINDKIVI
jgi:hypothetical protein